MESRRRILSTMLAALGGMDIHGRDEVTGRSPGD